MTPPNPSEAAREAVQGKSDMSVQRYKLEGGLREKHWCGQWIEYSAYEALESSLAEREQRIKVLEDALLEMADAVEAEINEAKAEGISYGEIPAWLVKARAALAATEGEEQ